MGCNRKAAVSGGVRLAEGFGQIEEVVGSSPITSTRAIARSAAAQRAVSASAHRHGMSRRQRQLDELRDLCRSGAVARAVDLAFEHVAAFGPDDDIIVLLAGAIERLEAPDGVRRRFAELRGAPG